MIQVDRRILRSVDWALLGVALGVVLAGLPVMYSASWGRGGGTELFGDHLLRLGLGLLVLVLAMVPDYRFVARQAWVFYGLNLAALLFVALSGIIGYGARRWLQLGPVALQPSELFKVTLILVLALYLSGPRPAGEVTGREMAVCLAITGVPLLLILRQPDLGTAAITLFIAAAMLLAAGLPRMTMARLAAGVAGVAVVSWAVVRFHLVRWEDFLKPYQLKRIMVLFDPQLDPLGASYHINQSKIAIGSGGLWGKGFLQGTQNQLRFLPQQHTDFIFSVLAEEWGFVGVAVVLSLYASLVLLALQVADEARDRVGGLVAVGVAAMIFSHTAVNIGMTVGYVPVVGLPLPLMSYGGSSFLVTMAGIGLLLNIRLRRYPLPLSESKLST